jgi:4,5-DOPA dioxygenase extradiol
MLQSHPTRLPVFFVGHGTAALSVLEDHSTYRSWVDVRESDVFQAAVRGARAIIIISAHYIQPSFSISSKEKLETIHDHPMHSIYGLTYEAAGSASFAHEVAESVNLNRNGDDDRAGEQLHVDAHKDLDHGSWLPLRVLIPHPHLPLLSLSIKDGFCVAEHLAFGRALAPLRDQGYLFIGSGSITHSQQMFRDAYMSGNLDAPEPAWISEFETAAIKSHNDRSMETFDAHRDFKRAHPTPDHFMPFVMCSGLGLDSFANVMTKTYQPGLSTSVVLFDDRDASCISLP